MIQVTLTREPTGPEGTFGTLTLPNGTELCTGELPWLNNRQNVSCIPEGEYEVDWAHSPRFGDCYHVRRVPGRSHILFHSGNFCGDESKGFETDVKGCILLGMSSNSELGMGQRAVNHSKVATGKFDGIMAKESFILTITHEDDENEIDTGSDDFESGPVLGLRDNVDDSDSGGRGEIEDPQDRGY